MLFTGLGRSVLKKTVASVFETSGTVFPNTDLPAGKYHIFRGHASSLLVLLENVLEETRRHVDLKEFERLR